VAWDCLQSTPIQLAPRSCARNHCLLWRTDDSPPYFVTYHLLQHAFAAASASARTVALRLDDRFALQTGKAPSTLGILTTNAVCFDESKQVSSAGLRGLFALTSRVNHSCSPNARCTWRDDTVEELVIAIRPIQQDEEITVSFDEDLCSTERALRRVDLHERFGFFCECEVCRSSTQTEAASCPRTRR
jgi:hypothetical protein